MYCFKVYMNCGDSFWIGHMILWQLSVTLLEFDDQGRGGQNGHKTCVFWGWLTSCALRIALTEWDGLVQCKTLVWRHRKMNIFNVNFIIQSKQIFDSISEGAWKLLSYLFLIFCRFHANNDDITIVIRHACEQVWFIYSHSSETGPKERLVCIGYFKT